MFRILLVMDVTRKKKILPCLTPLKSIFFDETVVSASFCILIVGWNDISMKKFVY